MIRYLLLLFFVLMLVGDELGLNISLAPGLSSKNALLYMVFVGILVNAAVERNRQLEALSVLVPFTLLIFYAIVSWVVVINFLEYPNYPLRSTLISLKSGLVDQMIALLVFFYGIRLLKDARWLIRSLVWVIILTNVVTIVDSMNIPNLGIIDSRLRDGRFEGFIGDANEYCALLLLFLPLTLASFWTGSGKLVLSSRIGAFLTLMCIVVTASRGGYVGFIVGMVLGAFLLKEHIPARYFVRGGLGMLGMLVLVLGITMFVGFDELVTDRMGKAGGGSLHYATSGRSTIWSNAIREMAVSPITFVTGYGFHAYENFMKFSAGTHNHYLNYLFNLGIIGLGLFIMIFVNVMRALRAAIPYADPEDRAMLIGLIFGLCGFLVSQLFVEYHSSGYLLWALLGAGLRLAIVAREDVEREPLNWGSDRAKVFST